VTDDLHLATIYFSVIGTDEDRKATEAGLNSAKGYLRREMGRALSLRTVPEIVFRYDESIEYGNRIENILKQIHDTEEADAEKDK
jgi:ribosome-binding factor A